MVLYNHLSTIVLLFETHIQLHTFYFDHNICFSVHSVCFGIQINIYIQVELDYFIILLPSDAVIITTRIPIT